MEAQIGDRIVTISETRWWKPGETGGITFLAGNGLCYAKFEGEAEQTWCLAEKDFVVVSRAGDPVQLRLF